MQSAKCKMENMWHVIRIPLAWVIDGMGRFEIFRKIQQPLAGWYNARFGKNGKWLPCYRFEHWPEWLK